MRAHREFRIRVKNWLLCVMRLESKLLPFQARRMAEAWVEESAEWKGELEALSHPALDGAWLFRFDNGGQLLLACQGAQMMEYQYDGKLDLGGKLDVFAAALAQFDKGGAS